MNSVRGLGPMPMTKVRDSALRPMKRVHIPKTPIPKTLPKAAPKHSSLVFKRTKIIGAYPRHRSAFAFSRLEREIAQVVHACAKVVLPTLWDSIPSRIGAGPCQHANHWVSRFTPPWR
jgi:hypothetical protein